MFFTLKIGKSFSFTVLLLTLTTIAAVVLSCIFSSGAQETAVEAEGLPTLVIDPGHGGIDSGAVSISGVKESDINLSIALRLKHIAEFFGIPVLMTRSDDSISSDAARYSERQELVRRTEIANSAPSAVLISIHQNYFPTSQPGGAQVLYADEPGSRELAEQCQNNILTFSEPQSRRLAEPAPDKLYITSHVNCPAILVECGFLSNFSDLEKLCDPSYNTGFAALLAGSYMQFQNRLY